MNILLRTKKNCPASKAFLRKPEETQNGEQKEKKNGEQERLTTGLDMDSTNSLDVVAMACDRGGLVCDFYSFKVR